MSKVTHDGSFFHNWFILTISIKLSFKRNVYKGESLRTKGEIYDQEFGVKT